MQFPFALPSGIMDMVEKKNFAGENYARVTLEL